MSEHTKFELSPSIAILLAGVIIAGAIVYVNLHPAAATVAAGNDAAPTVSAHVAAPSAADHIIGSPNAPIVLIEYSDFQCPFCNLIYPTLKRIVSESNGQIAWVYRNFPLTSIHPNALPAALAAECISDELGNNAFWKFADAIFANQSKMSDAYYAQVAQSLGANAATFKSCYDSQKFASKIDAQEQETEQNGGQGTPYTIVYGHGKQVPISGALPYEQNKSVIDSIK